MYSLGDLRTVVAEPKLALREYNRLYHTHMRQWEYNERAPNVFDEDWDNLILLDACRHDAFEQVLPEYDLPGESGHNYSRGASTMEFLRANLPGQDLSDTVYVTATSMLYRMIVIREEIEHNLHAVVDVWEEAIDMGEWGVRPERMADRVLEVAEEYPDKRIVAHFIQPHIPFIGEYGRERFTEKNIWQLKQRGELDATDEELWRAYMENLRVAMPSTVRLLRELPGKSVVTADHGQLIGERGFPVPFKEYGHPVGIYRDELVRVPWHVHQNGPRKQITAAGVGASSYSEKDREELDEKATEHLENLGYLG